ncbi:beta-N-acetylhexosaminidase [Schleiferilactobacillus shenzhenensis]|uniref:Uncharacterized protein n=1 Tax=Schleiferilactobacillus shenzhenensis LY-73 TaxID=1231336 RepID=U4TLI4_9LACO|nr:beta-N-acetylhexosaminidase [Schleiferilactobacillus shenzhenensis]ERL65726.1 hypothetical protein L248_2412 [Schleiferilactobacillus shenzhenensis LY-73]
MLKLNFTALPAALDAGVAIMAPVLGFTRAADGVAVTTAAEPGGPLLVQTGPAGPARIVYPTQAAFFRGLTALVQGLNSGTPVDIKETPRLQTAGLMFDMSRNAALTVAGLEAMLIQSARVGLNAALLYMEDVYAVPEYPYWGYQRGRLSQAELKAVDDFGAALGIEVIPCIQTLAHLLNPMKWPFMHAIQDAPGILLVDDPKTYTFLRHIIAAASAPFRTKKIHIGMDEAHDLGRGTYLDRHGLVDRTEIMLKHVRQVTAITKELGLHPIMWSDMWFEAAGHGYYDPQTQFSDQLKAEIPDVDLMYWDYYHDDETFYEQMIATHQELGRPVSLATGVWTWNGLAPNYGKTLATMNAGMVAAKVMGLTTVFATMWGDDGGETPFTAAALGIQNFAEQVYHQSVDSDRLAAAFTRYQGKKAADYLALDQFDQLPELTPANPEATNPSKIVLYEDLLSPLFAANTAKVDLLGHYRTLQTQLQAIVDRGQAKAGDQAVFVFYTRLAAVLVQKLAVMAAIRAAYTAGDRTAMKAAAAQLPALRTAVSAVRDAHRQCWFALYSPFGWEVLDVRYGGLLSRIDTVAWRLQQWLDGTVSSLAELDEPQLPVGTVTPASIGRGLYTDLASVSKISGV